MVKKNFFDYLHTMSVLGAFNPKKYYETKNIAREVDVGIKGRYAGKEMDKIAHLLPVWLSAQKYDNEQKYAHVEIGTLFGGSLIAKVKILQKIGKDLHCVVAIDPLEGYYGAKEDPNTMLPINESIVRENISRFNCLNSNYLLIKKYSNDPEVTGKLRKYEIITLLIDGDHSYEGVKNDWEKYSDLVIPKGYIIVDDYSNPNWPDIKQFMDQELSSRKDEWKICGTIGTSLILRKK